MAEPRVALLCEGLFTRATAKTAIGALRYAPYPIVAVVDSTRAGEDAASAVGVGAGVPVVASLAEARARGADVVLVGTAAPGGRIPAAYRPILAEALRSGIEVWSGLHERVLDDPALAAASCASRRASSPSAATGCAAPARASSSRWAPTRRWGR